MSTRRSFLKSVLATGSAVGIGSGVPGFLSELSAAAKAETDERILIVIQLTGGNDGLNTLVPFRHDAYRRGRPTLAISGSQVLSVSDELGFHPALGGFAQLLEQQNLAVVQGVGYSNPNRSHFESMDIWHTCRRKSESRTEGWLGQMVSGMTDEELAETPAIHLGREKQPLALASHRVTVPTIPSLKQFQFQRTRDEALEGLRGSSTPDKSPADLLGFVQSTHRSAMAISERLQHQIAASTTSVTYPETALGEKLSMISQLIASGLAARIYYVELDGFDTHAQQLPVHEALLRQLGDAVNALMAELSEQRQADRVLLMCFSEFGRRLEENASEGTDHGAAAPVFFIGPHIRPGIHGGLPSLTDLDQGDLKFHTDFRRLYASIVRDWFQIRLPVPMFDESIVSYPLLS